MSDKYLSKIRHWVKGMLKNRPTVIKAMDILLAIAFLGLMAVSLSKQVHAKGLDFGSIDELNAAAEHCLVPSNEDAVAACSQLLSSRVSLTLSQIITLYLARGNAYRFARDLRQAMQDYSQAIETDKNSRDAYVYRGSLSIQIGALRSAISDFNRAIELDPGISDAYYNRGVAYKGAEGCAKAFPDFDRAIALNPSFANPYYAKGVCEQQKGNVLKALSYYDKAIQIDPRFVDALYNRGSVYISQGTFLQRSL
ncbi:tetratricopeptide repeat protein [Mesorhizobium mediterraneum]|uniref:tetratricopeptide repeat protein n=1 Tax=Mesorhizobium mediterraneum TaxID=43617 RepID=UPI00177E6601|nr:tetratricopeptide repeat protein [Mesorhizobium mediterraneum]